GMITNMSKTYTFSGVFGFTTDTWGMLGIVQAVGNIPLMQKQYSQSEFTKRIESVIDNYRGIIEQEVPVFSNMRYKNKRMYQWAREGKAYLVPKLVREREIHSLTLDSIDFIRITNLKEFVLEDITLVRGDYRQGKILKEWNNLLRLLEGKFGTSLLFPRVTITATCEKGTYIRSIIHSLGQSFGIGAMTTAIHRIKVGEFSLDAAERLEV
ncbi:hypothetical protein KC573_03265, partial [candidate division WWE3 bacterium]|nr:hypothetical protein [candidate division WWE3 bacterium]